MRDTSCAAEGMRAAEHARNFLRRSLCVACRDEFFLYEKMGRRAIVHEGSTSEAGTEILPPITPKEGIPKGRVPLARAREQSSRGLSRPRMQRALKVPIDCNGDISGSRNAFADCDVINQNFYNFTGQVIQVNVLLHQCLAVIAEGDSVLDFCKLTAAFPPGAL